MNDYEYWLKGLEVNNLIVWQLEKDKETDTHLWSTKKQYEYKWNYYFTTPVFHVWQNGKHFCSTESLKEAYCIYNNCIKKKYQQEDF